MNGQPSPGMLEKNYDYTWSHKKDVSYLDFEAILMNGLRSAVALTC